VYDFGVLQLPEVASDALMVVSAAAVGALSCWLSFKFSLDASMRLFVITFLIVSHQQQLLPAATQLPLPSNPMTHRGPGLLNPDAV
jgi:hypothetical protein